MSQYEYSDQNKRKRFSASAPGAYPADTSVEQQFLASPHSADIGGDQQLEQPDYYRSAISPAHASSSGRFSDAASHHSHHSSSHHKSHDRGAKFYDDAVSIDEFYL